MGCGTKWKLDVVQAVDALLNEEIDKVFSVWHCSILVQYNL